MSEEDKLELEKRAPGERRGTKSILKPSKFVDPEMQEPLIDESKRQSDISASFQSEAPSYTSTVKFKH